MSQAFLAGMRASNGMGGTYARPSSMRSTDQTYTQNGNTPQTAATYSGMGGGIGRIAPGIPGNTPVGPNGFPTYRQPQRMTPEQQQANLAAYQGSAAQVAAMQAAQQRQMPSYAAPPPGNGAQMGSNMGGLGSMPMNYTAPQIGNMQQVLAGMQQPSPVVGASMMGSGGMGNQAAYMRPMGGRLMGAGNPVYQR